MKKQHNVRTGVVAAAAAADQAKVMEVPFFLWVNNNGTFGL